MLLAEEYPELRRRSVMELARRCRFDEPHAQHVARLALSLFHQTRELHKLDDSDGELLEYAALLHDIGFHVSPSGHHKHTAYLIATHDMVGFSRDEVSIIAATARYHRKAEPPANASGEPVKSRHEAFFALPRATRRRVRHLTALLRLADALDRTHARLVRAVRCQVHRKTLELRIEVDGDPELELWAARRKGDLLESLTDRKLRLAVDAVSLGRRPDAAPAADGAAPRALKKATLGDRTANAAKRAAKVLRLAR
jgi:exopolyphosphatase/guanosine-5'-triphosphate,3'-diphosphate pyrophosphatase